METQILSLLCSRPMVTTSEAASILQVSEAEVYPILAAIANTNAGAFALLSCTVDEAAQGSRTGTTATTTKVTMQKVDPATSFHNAADTMCALMSLTYPAHAAASCAPIVLRPSVGDSLRAYPVVSRTVMESRTVDAYPAAAVAAAPTEVMVKKEEVAPLAVKLDAVKRATADVTTPVSAATIAPASPALSTEPVPKDPVALTGLAAAEVKLPVMPVAPAETVTKQMPAPASPASTPTAAPIVPVGAEAPRKPTIFDKMKEAASTKRPRDGEGDGALTKVKKVAASKPKKTAKVESTTSLAKLSRASKKAAAGSAPLRGGPLSRSFLDEDDGDAVDGFSNSEKSTRDVASPSTVMEEAPVLGMVVPASNDEVILCDDAPPLAFRPAEPVVIVTGTGGKKDTTATKKLTVTAAAAEFGAAQRTLGTFFNPAVVEFQKSYVREVQTEMKVENGEYVCIDVPCYKHKMTGEAISEEEYRQRTAQLVHSRETAAQTPLRSSPSASSAGAAADSPSAPAAKSASPSPNDKAEKSTQSPAPSKTLLSFFKPAS